jgi:hypothetical protein
MKILKTTHLLFFLFLSTIGFSQTILSGEYTENQRWTKENSPYIINADVTINTDTVLIEKGTSISFADSSAKLYFYVSYFNATGDFDSPITFHGTSNKFNSVVVSKTGLYSEAYLENVHCDSLYRFSIKNQTKLTMTTSKFTESYIGLELDLNNDANINQTSFSNNSTGLFSYSSVNLSYVNFSNNQNALIFNGGMISNSFFDYNDIALDNQSQDSTYIMGTRFANNDKAIVENGNIQTTLFQNYFCNNSIDIENNHLININSYSNNTFCSTPKTNGKVEFPDYIEPNCLPTSISGTLKLDISGSPYTICTNTTVEKNGTLIIEKGVKLIFLDDSLFVYGNIFTTGTADSMVEFYSSVHTPHYRRSIFLENGSYNNFRGLKSLLDIESDTTLNITNCNFKEAEIVSTNIYADSCLISDINIYNTNFPSPTFTFYFKNCTFINGSSYMPGLDTLILENCKLTKTAFFNSCFYTRIQNCQFNSSRIDNFTRSICEIKNNTFTKNSHVLISNIGGLSTVDDNVFESNYSSLDILNGNCTTKNNQFINSEYGIEITENNEKTGSLPVFENNYFCNETDIWISRYHSQDIDLKKYDLSNNCWCKNNADSLSIKYDSLYFHPTNGKLFGDSLNFLPFASNCQPIIDSTSHKTYTISGTVTKENAGALNKGMAFLYNKYEPNKFTFTSINDGKFTFEYADSGQTYTILAAAIDEESNTYAPVFYQNKSSVVKANYFYTYGKISGLNMMLKYKPMSNTTTGNSFHYTVESLVIDSTNIKLLVNRKGEIISWAWAPKGVYEFDLPNESPLYIVSPHSGFSEDIYQIKTDFNGNYFLEKVDLITSINDQKTENTSFVYPNPVKSKLHITVEHDLSYKILNQQGSIINSGNSINGSIDVSDLENGVYLIKTIDGDNINIQQFIKIN